MKIINIMGCKVALAKERYAANDSTAIELISVDEEDYGCPFAVLTVCEPSYKPEENEILVKTWSENSFYPEVLATGYFSDTGKRLKMGNCEAQIWKIEDDSVFSKI
jgi:hypothetical protein